MERKSKESVRNSKRANKKLVLNNFDGDDFYRFPQWYIQNWDQTHFHPNLQKIWGAACVEVCFGVSKHLFRFNMRFISFSSFSSFCWLLWIWLALDCFDSMHLFFGFQNDCKEFSLELFSVQFFFLPLSWVKKKENVVKEVKKRMVNERRGWNRHTFILIIQ